MRCSTDSHNVLVQQATLNFLHDTARQVQDIDDIGHGASAMLDKLLPGDIAAMMTGAHGAR